VKLILFYIEQMVLQLYSQVLQ